jgi:hypothetical protein
MARVRAVKSEINPDEIADEKIKLWFQKLPNEKQYSPVTDKQDKYLKAFLGAHSDTYGNATASAMKALGRRTPPPLTKQKVNRFCNKHYRGMWKSTGKMPVKHEVPDRIEKPELVELSKGVLKKALTQDDNLALAQDTAKFVLKSTREFAEKQDPEAVGAISGLSISFASFRKTEKIEEAEVIEPKKIEGKIKRVK